MAYDDSWAKTRVMLGDHTGDYRFSKRDGILALELALTLADTPGSWRGFRLTKKRYGLVRSY